MSISRLDGYFEKTVSVMKDTYGFGMAGAFCHAAHFEHMGERGCCHCCAYFDSCDWNWIFDSWVECCDSFVARSSGIFQCICTTTKPIDLLVRCHNKTKHKHTECEDTLEICMDLKNVLPMAKFLHVQVQCLFTIFAGCKVYECFARHSSGFIIINVNAIILDNL